MKYWHERKTESGYRSSGIILTADDEQHGGYLLSVARNENGSITFREGCDGYYFRELSKDDALSMLDELRQWITGTADTRKPEPQDRYPLQSLGCQKIKGNCLCHRCHPDVKNLMSYCSGTYIAHGKPVKQAAIYQTLRESGNTHEPAEIIARIDQLIETKIVQKNQMYFTVALESAISALDNNAPMPKSKQGGGAVDWGSET